MAVDEYAAYKVNGHLRYSTNKQEEKYYQS